MIAEEVSDTSMFDMHEREPSIMSDSRPQPHALQEICVARVAPESVE